MSRLSVERVDGRLEFRTPMLDGAARAGSVLLVMVIISLLSASAAWGAQPGVLSDYAGTGASGTPTPGPATSSELANPSGVAVDAAGNVYIADSQLRPEARRQLAVLHIKHGCGRFRGQRLCGGRSVLR